LRPVRFPPCRLLPKVGARPQEPDMTDRPLTPTEYDSLRRAAMQRAAALR
jgi:hypothetical protein